jgi:hypothetical protein
MSGKYCAVVSVRGGTRAMPRKRESKLLCGRAFFPVVDAGRATNTFVYL